MVCRNLVHSVLEICAGALRAVMKIVRIVIGTFGGAFISAVCVASFSWLVIYNSDPGTGVQVPLPGWAYLAGVLGTTTGFIIGLPLGLVISVLNRGWIAGTFFGLLAGLVLVVWLSQTSGHPDIIYPTVPLLFSFLPAGALSGFLTSLVVSAVSQAESVQD